MYAILLLCATLGEKCFFLADGEKFSKMADGRNNPYLGEKLEQKLNIISSMV
jgi:hypothetical protein